MKNLAKMSNAFKRLSIGRKLLITLLLFSMIPVLLIGIFSYNVSSGLIRDKVSDVTEELIGQVTKNYELKVNEINDITLNIMTTKSLQDNVLDVTTLNKDHYDYFSTRKDIEDFLSHQTITNKDIKGIVIISEKDTFGKLQDFSIDVESNHIQQIFEQIRKSKGQSVWDAILNEITDERGIIVGRLLTGGAILLVEIDNAQFNQGIQDIQLGKTGYLSVTDKDLKVIFSTKDGELKDSSHLEKELKAIEYEENAASTFISKKNELVTAKPIDHTDWILYSSVPISELITETREIALVTIIIGIITFALSFGVAVFIARKMIRPITRVTDMMKEVEVGNLTIADEIADMDTDQVDEIGQLTISLKNMVEGIRTMLVNTSHTAEILSQSSIRLSENAVYNRQLSTQTNDSIKEVAYLANETVISTEESATAFDSIAIDLQKIAEASSVVSNNSLNMTEEARKGHDFIANAVNEIDKVSHTVGEAVQLIHELEERSKQIAQITKIISSIADQTNLLALNAAIEAARAGEHGLGFTVVADEVRKLARQSQDATKDIGDLISKIQSTTESTVKIVTTGREEVVKGTQAIEEAGQQFQTILTSVQDITDQIRDVNGIIHEISANSEEVSATVHVMNEHTHHSNEKATTIQNDIAKQLESIDQASVDSKELENISQRLLEAIQQFKV
ncbi:methyl-accepting chemotaxis protein [Pseudogracilibacillus auburnensis]|uniref:methyl-accepting chemotaxis protein n=1 Tax=Pseudogracilibacillus auburnensis TaxID=1494959 RepID=UPI001A9632DC|nr:methyl-accepting chemotaxis protein [Pseudogracilibacillus auburnensis]MBO1005899.1 HAMP domain-containing protein [Pseudogracilibacillus auburnensis]